MQDTAKQFILNLGKLQKAYDNDDYDKVSDLLTEIKDDGLTLANYVLNEDSKCVEWGYYG